MTVSIVKPTPADPTTEGTWGALINTALDAIVAGVNGEITRALAAEALLASLTDSRFTDNRTPVDGSVTTAKIASGGIAQSTITGLTAALAGKAAPADITTAITALGLGSASTHPSSDFATPASVSAAITALVNGAPGILDTLGEIATQLQSDESAAAALTTLVNSKAATTALTTETNRATAAEGVNTTAIGNEVTRATAAEGLLALPDTTSASATPQAAVGQTLNATTVGAAVSSPTLPGSVGAGAALARWAVKAPSSGTCTVTYPNSTGTAETVTLLAGEVLTFRQKSTSGWGAESGNKPLTQLDGRYVGQSIDASTPAAPLVNALRRATRSTSIQLISDSTGLGVVDPANPSTTTDGWFADFARQLAARYPGFTAYFRQLNSSTFTLDGPMKGTSANYVKLQDGTANSAGARGINLQGGIFAYDLGATSPLTGNIELVFDLMPDTWTPAADQCIGGQWSTANNQRGYYLALRTTGVLQLNYSLDGSATVTANSTVAVPFTGAGVRGKVKANITVNNGASGRDVKFYTSTDGYTWTQLGSTVTVATAATVYAPATAPAFNWQWSTATSAAVLPTPLITDTNRLVLVGGRMTSGVFGNQFHGVVYAVEVRNGIDGPSVVPELLEDWEQLTDDQFHTIVGAPVLTFVNVSASGRNLAYFIQYAANLLTTTTPNLVMVSSSHNDSYFQRQQFVALYQQFITLIRAAYGAVPLVLMSQNPIVVGNPSGGTGTNYTQQAQDRRVSRHEAIATLATGTAGCSFVDVFQAFNLADITNEVGLGTAPNTDNLHPKRVSAPNSQLAADVNSGCRRWANYMLAQLFASR